MIVILQWHPSGDMLAALPAGCSFVYTWNAATKELQKLDTDFRVCNQETALAVSLVGHMHAVVASNACVHFHCVSWMGVVNLLLATEVCLQSAAARCCLQGWLCCSCLKCLLQVSFLTSEYSVQSQQQGCWLPTLLEFVGSGSFYGFLGQEQSCSGSWNGEGQLAIVSHQRKAPYTYCGETH